MISSLMPPSTDRLPVSHVYKTVLDEVASGRYRPGDRIAITDLAHRLSVSATPIREALSRLVGRGLLEQRRSEGYYLARLDARDISDLYAFHKVCIIRALPDALKSNHLALAPEGEAWTLFDQITFAAGDAINYAVRGYLDDRLTPLRRFEERVLGLSTETESRLIIQCIQQPEQMMHAINHFHELRRTSSHEFAIQFSRY
jgi:DNA-binding transcriptional regulator YhcF (GntR family)